jgi:hypothetical protein
MMGVIDYLVFKLRADSVSSALAAIQLSLLSVEGGWTRRSGLPVGGNRRI